MDLFPWFLFAHVLGAIIAFGASFSTFPLLGAMSGKEPTHANFGARVGDAIGTRVVRPLAILQGITGVGLILTRSIDLTKALWLDAGIVLYLIALGYALFVQIPTGHRVVELTRGGPPATPPAGAAPGGAAQGGGAPRTPAGPPPELLATVAKARRGGALIAMLITIIVFLMVVKPSF